MKVDRLRPFPTQKTQFAWSHRIVVPQKAGCYALVTYGGDVLYVGLATTSIRDRMDKHLETPEKRQTVGSGAAFWFYYHVGPREHVGPIERGWMNQAILEDGEKPVLNKIYSPL